MQLVSVKTCKNRTEAAIVKSFLESNGIEAIISADDEGGMYPFPLQPTPKGAQVLVKKEDYEKALKLLKTK